MCRSSHHTCRTKESQSRHTPIIGSIPRKEPLLPLRGTEDVSSHERQGIAGDWRNHLSGKVLFEIKKRFGSLLIATGYEKRFDW
jgi:hypothetical protein